MLKKFYFTRLKIGNKREQIASLFSFSFPTCSTTSSLKPLFLGLSFADGTSNKFASFFLFFKLSLFFTLNFLDQRFDTFALFGCLPLFLVLEQCSQYLHVIDNLLLARLEDDGDALQGLVLLATSCQMLRFETVRQISLEISRNLQLIENLGLSFNFGVQVIGIDLHLDASVALDLTQGSHPLPFQLLFFW
jgi:hypothetical protein